MELTFEVTLNYGEGPELDEPTPTADDLAGIVVAGLDASPFSSAEVDVKFLN